MSRDAAHQKSWRRSQMIVRQFLHWVRNAPAADRAEASGNLARAYLYSDLSPDDRAAAEGALIMLLDDPSPLVRAELARALAFSENAPPAVIHGLAADQPEIASWVLEHSPLLVDADLVDAVAIGTPEVQIAIASRAKLPCAVSAAIAEVGAAEACLVLIENLEAEIAPFSLDRIVGRFGHLPVIRESMLLRDDLPAATRQQLVAKLSETLVGFVTARAWLEKGRAQRVAREACEKATVTLAATSPQRRNPAADPAPARKRPAQRRPGAAGAAVRQCRVVRGGAGRSLRHADRARQRAGARPGQRRLPRGVRPGRPAGHPPIRRSARRSKPCARAASSATSAAQRVSSGAWSSAC